MTGKRAMNSLEATRRLSELRSAVQTFLKQEAEDHVYWVERGGRSQRSLTLNAAPVDVADFLRDRLFGSNTSIVMTSATLGMDAGPGGTASGKPMPPDARRGRQSAPRRGFRGAALFRTAGGRRGRDRAAGGIAL